MERCKLMKPECSDRQRSKFKVRSEAVPEADPLEGNTIFYERIGEEKQGEYGSLAGELGWELFFHKLAET